MKRTSESFVPDQSACDRTLAALALGKRAADAGLSPPLERVVAAHLAACPHCQEERGRAEAVERALSAHVVPPLAADASARTLAAAAPLLARRAAAARDLRRRVVWALAVTLLPLPLLLLANVKLLQATHDLLLTALPPPLALYLTLSLGAGIALLLALSYTAVPLLALRRRWLPSLEEVDVDVHARA